MQSRPLGMDASTIAAVIFGTVSLTIGRGSLCDCYPVEVKIEPRKIGGQTHQVVDVSPFMPYVAD
ncbi:hypothetical protein MY3296_009909 [Beauveria thailandica]